MDKSKMGQFLDAPGLHGLNATEKDQIKEFLKNPGKDEFFFLRRLLGKTPAQVRNMMIDEFVRRYDLSAYSEEITKALPARRSWRDLDLVITKFAGSMEVDEHLQFWDRMRYVLAALPKRKDYGDKYADRHEMEATRPKRGWRFTTCRLCWRMVPCNAGLVRKTGPLCFVHNLPATHSIYRKHNRLARKLFVEQQIVVKKLMALMASCSSDADIHKNVLAHLVTPNECMPRLAEYLTRVGHNGDHESLLWAFHGPASDEMDALYKEAMDEYIQNTLTAKDIFDADLPVFIFSIAEMSRAEAWLTLLDRDGRRRKS